MSTGVTDHGIFEAIIFEVRDHVATITLNRPEAMNSFDRTMCEEIVRAWSIVRDTDDIHVAVLRAAGDRAFCTGIDVKAGAWWFHLNIWNQMDPGASLGARSNLVWKPVVCAVNGLCAGGGQYLVNEADIVICSDDAEFFDPHANNNIVSACEPVGMLQRGVPIGEVLRWALMGNEERIGAESALRIGLVSEVVLPRELHARADDIARQIAARNPVAIQGTVRAIWEAAEMPPHIARQNALAYTHIGNRLAAEMDNGPRTKGPKRVR